MVPSRKLFLLLILPTKIAKAGKYLANYQIKFFQHSVTGIYIPNIPGSEASSMPASATADTSASAPPAGNSPLKLHVVKDQEISSGGEWKG